MGTRQRSATPSGASMAGMLLSWAQGHGRDLPWRQTRDPWAVLVSEVMLQQTQVVRVVPRYTAFLEAFPTPAACAAAPLGEVLRHWSGLGYNRRAVNLHRAAQVVAQRPGGRLPDDLPGLLELPGVGSYTARAVLAFAFERDHGVLDTNAARVLARAVAGGRLSGAKAQRLADAQVPRGQGWAWNQAVLDLGATVCLRRSPRCEACPLRPVCAWAADGFRQPDPADASAGVSGRQTRFEGSDRQGRGRLVRALTIGPLDLDQVPAVAGWPDDADRARRIMAALVDEGLAAVDDDRLVLPA